MNIDLSQTMELQNERLGRWDTLAKRTLDVTLSVVGLILLAPLLAVAVAAIAVESKGPVIFRQRRCGFDNREFKIFKFRTMTVLEDGDNVVQVKQNDERVTRVGRVLRRHSIDELPQLINVIFGEMSLVGPRPHAMAHHKIYVQLIGNYALRHHVRPGLTGMAQIRGLRGETANLVQMEQRVEQDIWYVNNWSFALDLWILARTCLVIFGQNSD